jgi:hypothetical protein
VRLLRILRFGGGLADTAVESTGSLFKMAIMARSSSSTLTFGRSTIWVRLSRRRADSGCRSPVRADVAVAKPHATAFLWRRDRRHRHKSLHISASERRGVNSSPHSVHGRGSCFTRRARLYAARFSGWASHQRRA